MSIDTHTHPEQKLDSSASLCHPTYGWVDTSVGGVSRRNNVQMVASLPLSSGDREVYAGMFRFGEDYLRLCHETGSVSGAGNLLCYSDFVWIDVDRTDLNQALLDARQILVNADAIEPGLSQLAVVYFSGCKGFHIGFPSPLFGLGPSIDLPKLVKQTALAISGGVPIDYHIYDKNRLLRVPNSRHGKSGLYKTFLTIEQISTWSVARIMEEARVPHGEARPALLQVGEFEPIPALVDWATRLVTIERPSYSDVSDSRSPKAPGWMAQALANLTEGNRNSTFAAVIGRLHRLGASIDEISSLLRPHAEKHDFSLSELESEIVGICGRYPRQESDTSGSTKFGWKPMSLSELLKLEVSQPQWLVKSLFPSQGVAIIAGKPGIGKSWMSMDLAIAVARGEAWLGKFETCQSTVGYIDLESSPQMLRDRFRMLLNARGVNGDLGVSFLVGPDLSFNSSDSLSKLDNWLTETKPGLIVIDCLVRSHVSDENSATDMAKVFGKIKGLVRKHECLFVIADHHRKPGEQEASADTMLRGSSEKLAFADCLVSLRSDGKNIVFEHSKARQGKAVDSFVLCLEDHGEDKIWLRVVGDRAALKKQETDDAILEFLKSVFADSAEASRKELVALSGRSRISKKSLEAFLKSAPKELLVRQDRQKASGKGGKEAIYRPGSEFPFSSPYIGEKRGTGNSGGEAA